MTRRYRVTLHAEDFTASRATPDIDQWPMAIYGRHYALDTNRPGSSLINPGQSASLLQNGCACAGQALLLALSLLVDVFHIVGPLYEPHVGNYSAVCSRSPDLRVLPAGLRRAADIFTTQTSRSAAAVLSQQPLRGCVVVIKHSF